MLENRGSQTTEPINMAGDPAPWPLSVLLLCSPPALLIDRWKDHKYCHILIQPETAGPPEAQASLIALGRTVDQILGGNSVQR